MNINDFEIHNLHLLFNLKFQKFISIKSYCNENLEIISNLKIIWKKEFQSYRPLKIARHNET